MSFNFGGNDPDEVANLTRQLEDSRLTMQNMQAEMQLMREDNVMLKQKLESILVPNDLVRVVVKIFSLSFVVLRNCLMLIFEYFSDGWDQIFGR